MLAKGDDQFTQSLDGLSRALGERAALHPDPAAEAMARRISVQAGFAVRERRLKFILGGIATGLGSAIATVLLLFFAWPPDGKSSPSPSHMVAVADPPAAAPVVADPVIPDPVIPAAVDSSEFAAPSAATHQNPPSPSPAPALGRKEVREVQTRLRALGFNPGPVDGDAGRMTATAVTAYQEKRGLPQTGELDRALLDQLRREPEPKPSAAPAPQIAQHTTRRPPPPAGAPQQRAGGGGALDFLRTADANLTRWFQSLGH